MANIPKLRDDHFRLMSTVRRLGVLIERLSPPPTLHLMAVRHELSSTLTEHLQDEDWLLYPQLLGSPHAHIAATARIFSDEMGDFAETYAAHCERWSAQSIAADWPDFCGECREILDALTIRITRENRELFPLLEMAARPPENDARLSAAAATIGPRWSSAFPSSCATAGRNGLGSGRLPGSA
jgi:hypothetical protein